MRYWEYCKITFNHLFKENIIIWIDYKNEQSNPLWLQLAGLARRHLAHNVKKMLKLVVKLQNSSRFPSERQYFSSLHRCLFRQFLISAGDHFLCCVAVSEFYAMTRSDGIVLFNLCRNTDCFNTMVHQQGVVFFFFIYKLRKDDGELLFRSLILLAPTVRWPYFPSLE